MNGYFLYTFYGEKNELEEVEDKLDSLSGDNDDYIALTSMSHGIQDNDGNTIKAPYCLSYGSYDKDSDVSEIPFLFEDMMTMLSEDFPECEITGTGYVDDSSSVPFWHKTRGNDEYTEEDMGSFIGIVSKEDYMDELDQFKFYSDTLNRIMIIPARFIREYSPTMDTSCVFEYKDETGSVMYGEFVV